MNITDETVVIADAGEPCASSWREFLLANDFEPEEIAEIKATLQRGQVYQGGGGAAAEWTVAASIPRSAVHQRIYVAEAKARAALETILLARGADEDSDERRRLIVDAQVRGAELGRELLNLALAASISEPAR